MKSSSDFHHFAANLQQNGMQEIDKAVACLWYCAHSDLADEMTASEIASSMMEVGLAGNVNRSRLAKKLRQSRMTVKGSANNSFRISPIQKSKLDDEFQPFLKRRKVKVSDDLLPDDVIQGTGTYLHKLAYQLNGTYDNGFYDACAVLCRRVVESLLIGCFDAAGKLSVIQKSDGSLKMLDAIVGEAKSGQHIRLPRGTAKVIDKIKEVGDTAAHDRYHLTTKQDIDEFRTGFRKVVSQLQGLAGTSSTSGSR